MKLSNSCILDIIYINCFFRIAEESFSEKMNNDYHHEGSWKITEEVGGQHTVLPYNLKLELESMYRSCLSAVLVLVVII